MTDQERTDFIFRTVNTPHQFSYENGITVTHVEPGYAKGELVVGPNSINPHKNVHGGAMATLADTVGGCCACSRGRRLRHRGKHYGIFAPRLWKEDILCSHAQEDGPHPVCDPGGAHQRPGCSGGHRHFHLFYDGLIEN